MALASSENIAFERRWWRVQRIGRVLLLLGLAAAVLGIFGTGPLAHSTARAPDGSFLVDYDRFVRSTQSSELEISMRSLRRSARIEIAQGYLDATRLSAVSPQPDSETASSGRVVLSYEHRPSRIELEIVPGTIGMHRATIWVDGTPTTFRQLTWP